MDQAELNAHVTNGMAGAQQLVSQLSGLDDRTFIISVAAFLDESLKELIAKYLIDDAEISEWAINSSGPLATFSARIKIARGIGLITKEEYRDLELLRKIRNNAAHKWDGFTLSAGPERGRAASISHPKFMKPDGDTPRKNLEARVKELLAWVQLMNTWVNVPFADGAAGIRRLEEVPFALKMVPVQT